MIELKDDGAIRFHFSGPNLGPVYLVGDFNGWDERAHPMRSAGKNQWKTDLKLRPGDYRFLYRVGARWYVDADAPDVPNPWGSEFSVVSVPEGARQRPVMATQ